MMEATDDKGLVDAILPPRLEDAGLEECALPPESIKEAFLKAASALKSRATSMLAADDDDGDCVPEPWPQAKAPMDDVVGVPPVPGGRDVLVGIEREGEEEEEETAACLAEKGGGVVEEGRDEVVVGRGGDVAEGGREKGCVVEGGEEEVKKSGGSGGVDVAEVDEG